MSGGRFNYHQYKIDYIADEVEQLIRTNDDTTLNEWGDTIGKNYPANIIAEFKRGLAHLRLAAIYAHRIDWLVSGDDGEETFVERLQDDLDILRMCRKDDE